MIFGALRAGKAGARRGGVILLLMLLLLGGCATTRTFEINATPPDAMVQIDGINKGRGQVEVPITFNSVADTHTISAQRPGYMPASITVDRDYPDTNIDIQLQPFSRRIHLAVIPQGYLKIDGNPVSSDMVSEADPELNFTMDQANHWTTYTVTADRLGFSTATTRVSYDPDVEGSTQDYTLTLHPAPMHVTITTTPPGATIMVDARDFGVSPASGAITFRFDGATESWLPRTITALKAGWAPATMRASYGDRQVEYHLDLIAKTKEVAISTEPPGGTVVINGATLPRNAAGESLAQLKFPPINDAGTLPTYTAVASLKAGGWEWMPKNLSIGWDGGQRDYSVKLREITTGSVATVEVGLRRDDQGLWQVYPRLFTTVASKFVTEGRGPNPVEIYQAPAGQTIGSLAVSPDGSQVLFTLLIPDPGNFRSLILAKKIDGSGQVQQINDGNSLDVMPSYDANGDSIAYCSNRAGRTLSIWERSISGEGGILALTANRDEMDLWPALDASPRTRLFYEALYDGQTRGHLYMTTLGATTRTEFNLTGISQPRVSPKADSVVYVSTNPKTGRREIYLQPVDGSPAELLVASPDADNYDPSFSHDGTRLAFTSDRAVDEDHRHNPDIWILNINEGGSPIQITSNESVDDCPVWDPAGGALYFRSNRGGAWGIWKIDVK